jgi:hypothetical protein
LSDDPDVRPSFDEIQSWLEVCEFKLTPKVDSKKVRKFVKGIEGWEKMQESEVDVVDD